MRVFWAKGFAATSTDDLNQAMGIGRQSLYNAFGDKRALYLEALRFYQQKNVTAHLRRLNAPASALEGVRDLLIGLAPTDDALRTLGCMGVGSVSEFGVTDSEIATLRITVGTVLHARLVERLKEARAAGETDPSIDPQEAAGFVQIAMSGLQIAARSGAAAPELHKLAAFAVDRLRAK